MSWDPDSPSTSYATGPSAPSSPGARSRPASTSTGCGATRTRRMRRRPRCSATHRAPPARDTGTRVSSTSSCSAARSVMSAASTAKARTSSISPARSTPCRARKAASSPWCGSGPTRFFATSHADVGWHAALELGFDVERGATRLGRRAHRGPLVVQRPFFPEGDGVCHVYVLHPPGGLVGGDELALDLDVDAGAHALVTTPAATKIYRTTGAPA